MTISLTLLQQQTLGDLHDFEALYGRSPSVRELARFTGAPSLGNLHDRICALEERGHLLRLGGPRPGNRRPIALFSQPPVSTAPDGAPLYFLPAPHRTGDLPCPQS